MPDLPTAEKANQALMILGAVIALAAAYAVWFLMLIQF